MATEENFIMGKPTKAKEKLACVHADLEVRDQKRLPEGEFAISLGGVPYTERVEAGTALLSIISKCKTGEKTELGSYQGFTLFVEKNFMGLNYLVRVFLEEDSL